MTDRDSGIGRIKVVSVLGHCKLSYN